MQRALIQFGVPKNYEIVKKALIKAGREDLIGSGKDCLIPSTPPKSSGGKGRRSNTSKNHQGSNTKNTDSLPKRKSNHSKTSRKKRSR